mmetsp:Transcript_8885/g.11674  ORF Transcript_8885/g.11674 Transcript_8885/m.11674 type:complete len:2131 (-) Transcript_8885:300-6692(-)
MGINGFLVLVSGLLLLLEVASRENAADVGQIFSDGGLPRKNTDTLKLVPEDIYTDRALAGALHNESWYASGYGESCTTGCQAVGLICDENELYAHNSEVDSTSELLSMIESLGYSTSATYCWSYSDSYYNYVPGWTSYSCSVASSSLSLSTYDCESIYYSGYRLCYCVEEETSSPTLSMATSNTAGYTGSCILTLNQFDSYGDGWNGYYFGLYEYGSSTALQSITLSSGSSSSVCLSYASSGSCYTFQVSSTGSFSSEISWNLCGTSGDTSTSLDFCIDSSGACTVGAETSSPTLSMTYSDTAGYTGHCITSPGWYCSAVTGNVEECSIGYYCPDYNMTAQLDCPAGYYCNETGLTAATECGEGYYCESTGMTVPTECPIAYYCPEFTAIDATECPSGYYCGETGLYAATQCGVGYYCSSTMMTAPTECPISYYCPESTATTGTICPQGYYCDETGLSAPTECGAGYYCNSTGMAAPTLCPEGHYCGTVTTVSPTECGYGYYCNGTGLAEPTICPAGTMCNETTLATPFACPEFDGDMKVFCKQGSSDIGICPEGSYCSDAATIAECPIGSYCPRGSESPIACETENYEVCPYENMTEPMYCATENQNGVLCYETGITECSAEVTPAGLTYSCTCWGLWNGDTCNEEQDLTSSFIVGFFAFFITLGFMIPCLCFDGVWYWASYLDGNGLYPLKQKAQKMITVSYEKQMQIVVGDTKLNRTIFQLSIANIVLDLVIYFISLSIASSSSSCDSEYFPQIFAMLITTLSMYFSSKIDNIGFNILTLLFAVSTLITGISYIVTTVSGYYAYLDICTDDSSSFSSSDRRLYWSSSWSTSYWDDSSYWYFQSDSSWPAYYWTWSSSSSWNKPNAWSTSSSWNEPNGYTCLAESSHQANIAFAIMVLMLQFWTVSKSIRFVRQSNEARKKKLGNQNETEDKNTKNCCQKLSVSLWLKENIFLPQYNCPENHKLKKALVPEGSQCFVCRNENQPKQEEESAPEMLQMYICKESEECKYAVCVDCYTKKRFSTHYWCMVCDVWLLVSLFALGIMVSSEGYDIIDYYPASIVMLFITVLIYKAGKAQHPYAKTFGLLLCLVNFILGAIWLSVFDWYFSYYWDWDYDDGICTNTKYYDTTLSIMSLLLIVQFCTILEYCGIMYEVKGKFRGSFQATMEYLQDGGEEAQQKAIRGLKVCGMLNMVVAVIMFIISISLASLGGDNWAGEHFAGSIFYILFTAVVLLRERVNKTEMDIAVGLVSFGGLILLCWFVGWSSSSYDGYYYDSWSSSSYYSSWSSNTWWNRRNLWWSSTSWSSWYDSSWSSTSSSVDFSGCFESTIAFASIGLVLQIVQFGFSVWFLAGKYRQSQNQSQRNEEKQTAHENSQEEIVAEIILDDGIEIKDNENEEKQSQNDEDEEKRKDDDIIEDSKEEGANHLVNEDPDEDPVLPEIIVDNVKEVVQESMGIPDPEAVAMEKGMEVIQELASDLGGRDAAVNSEILETISVRIAPPPIPTDVAEGNNIDIYDVIEKMMVALFVFCGVFFVSLIAEFCQILANVFLIVKSFEGPYTFSLNERMDAITEKFSRFLEGIDPNLTFLADVYAWFIGIFENFSINIIALESMNVTCIGSQAPAELFGNLLVILLIIFIYESHFYRYLMSIIRWIGSFGDNYKEKNTTDKDDKGQAKKKSKRGDIMIAGFNKCMEGMESSLKYLIQLVATIITVKNFLPYHSWSPVCGSIDATLALMSTVLGWVMTFCALHVITRTFVWGLPEQKPRCCRKSNVEDNGTKHFSERGSFRCHDDNILLDIISDPSLQDQEKTFKEKDIQERVDTLCMYTKVIHHKTDDWYKSPKSRKTLKRTLNTEYSNQIKEGVYSELPSYYDIWYNIIKDLRYAQPRKKFKTIGNYVYTLVWKFGQLLKLTAGYWDETLINNFKISEMANHLGTASASNACVSDKEDGQEDATKDDLNQKMDFENAENKSPGDHETSGTEEGIVKQHIDDQEMICIIGESHSLIWQFAPALVSVAKFGEYGHAAPIYVENGDNRDGIDHLFVADDATTSWNKFISFCSGRFLKWFVSVGKFVIAICLALYPKEAWFKILCFWVLPLKATESFNKLKKFQIIQYKEISGILEELRKKLYRQPTN